MATTGASAHKRGGSHRTHGVFQGGGALDDRYELTSKIRYKYTSQLCNTKSIEKIEANLQKFCQDSTLTKFKGNLEELLEFWNSCINTQNHEKT